MLMKPIFNIMAFKAINLFLTKRIKIKIVKKLVTKFYVKKKIMLYI